MPARSVADNSDHRGNGDGPANGGTVLQLMRDQSAGQGNQQRQAEEADLQYASAIRSQRRREDEFRAKSDEEFARKLQKQLEEDDKKAQAAARQEQENKQTQAAIEQRMMQEIEVAAKRAQRDRNNIWLNDLLNKYGNVPGASERIAAEMAKVSALPNASLPAAQSQPQLRLQPPSAPALSQPDEERKAVAAAQQQPMPTPNAPAPEADLETQIALLESTNNLDGLLKLADQHRGDLAAKTIIEAAMARVQEEDLVAHNDEPFMRQDEADQELIEYRDREHAAQRAAARANEPKNENAWIPWLNRNKYYFLSAVVIVASLFFYKKYASRTATASAR